MYFDTAVAGYWRALAAPYAATMALLQGDIYVRKATLEYHASARYDDLCDAGIRCERIGKSSIIFVAAVFRGGELLVSGELVYVFADPATQKSVPVPAPLRELFVAFESGRTMLDVRLGSWEQLGAQAQQIRAEVFIDEQRIPAEMVSDAADASAVHAVAFNHFGMPLATGRLLRHEPGVAKIGRMAVRQGMRGGGLGRAVLQALMSAARERGEREVLLNAQMSAVAFYLRAGFIARGTEFEEAGIPHLQMAHKF